MSNMISNCCSAPITDTDSDLCPECLDHCGRLEECECGDDCPPGLVSGYCTSCSGSGEGMVDGSKCRSCKGSGEAFYFCEKCNGDGWVPVDE